MNAELETTRNHMISLLTMDFMILDEIIETIVKRFQNPDIRFNRERGEIVFKINDGYTAVSSIDFNTFYVVTRIGYGMSGTVVAENQIGFDGFYRETFSRFDIDTKSQVINWFDDISKIQFNQYKNDDNSESDKEDVMEIIE